MTEQNRIPSEIGDAEFEKLIDSHFARSAEQQLGKLDRRMAHILDQEPVSQTLRQKRRWYENPYALRLAVSHAVVAGLFFGMALLWQSQSRPDANFSTGAEQSAETSARTAAPFFKDEETKLFSFEKVAGPENVDPISLLEQQLAAELPTPTPSSLGNFGMTADADQNTSAAANISASAAVEPTTGVIEAQYRDGYLYVLTPNAVVRMPLEGAESLIANLESPAGWRFDGEGNLWVVDQTSEGAVLYKLVRQVEPNK